MLSVWRVLWALLAGWFIGSYFSSFCLGLLDPDLVAPFLCQVWIRHVGKCIIIYGERRWSEPNDYVNEEETVEVYSVDKQNVMATFYMVVYVFQVVLYVEVVECRLKG